MKVGVRAPDLVCMPYFLSLCPRFQELFEPYDPSLYDMFGEYGGGCGCNGFHSLGRLKCFGG